jgi:probable phosphoglycerate mutase
MRHGQVAYFVDGGPCGRRGAAHRGGPPRDEQTARRSRGSTFDRVITSGSPRRRDGADRRAGPRAESWPELRELEAAGSQTCRSGGRVRQRVQRHAPEDATFLGGETIGSLLDRACRAAAARGEPDWDIALVVAHGGTIRALLSFALTGGRAFLGNFELAPASISILDVGDDWIVRAVNVTPYDLAHTRTRLRTMEELWAQYKSM